jgi:uncharacterized protein (DUF1499 family)
MFTKPIFWFAVLIGIIALPLILLKVLSLTGKKPERSGAPAILADCPDSPNCVCSEESRPDHSIAPIIFQGEKTAAWSELQSVLKKLGGTEVRSGDQYLWYEFRTPLIGFVDDVECRLNPEGQRIEIRSASRVGRSDLGANRKRIEAIRRAFHAGS